MADDSAYYGSGVLTYDENTFYTEFSDSTQGFIFREAAVDDGTPISQLSVVNILYGQPPTLDQADGCGDLSADTELTIHSENSTTMADFCNLNEDEPSIYSNSGTGSEFKIMSVLPSA